MESLELKIDERTKALTHWLQTDCRLSSFSLKAMQADASFRRYFRIQTSATSLVAMDAPPPQENCHPYVAIANALREMGLNTPDIIEANVQQGFLLITDFGDTTYLNALNTNNADQLYHRALDALAVLQACSGVKDHSIPPFTRDFMWQEWAWHKEWFLHKLLHLSPANVENDLDACFHLLVESAATQPQVFMHRDYHSANLMTITTPQFAENALGILDFQDAFIGPVTYDLASLLRDCYIAWPQEQVKLWASAYWRKLRDLGVLPDVSQHEFLRWFDWMGMERHLKALFTFARKQVRDHQSQYLKHIPRTLQYLLNVSQQYPEFAALHHYLHKTVQPAFAREVLL